MINSMCDNSWSYSMSGRITSDTRDANGNMTHEGGVPRFAYNPEGKLTTREGYTYSYVGRAIQLDPLPLHRADEGR